MKNKFYLLLFISFFCLLSESALSQQLDVEGNSKIRGRLDLSLMNDNSTLIIGNNAGLNVDRISNLSYQNTFIGSYSGQMNQTGTYNTAIGFAILFSLISGSNNTAVGYGSLSTITSGHNNTAVGSSALAFNSIGYDNTAIGLPALYSNTSGFNNTASGVNALHSNSTGIDNTAIGKGTLFSNNTGESNTAVCFAAMLSNNEGSNNTASGAEALHCDTSGYYNTANGRDALHSNKTGNENTAVGFSAGSSNQSGRWNTFIGSQVARDFVSGDNNIFIGQGCGLEHTGGNNNILIGHAAGRTNNNSNNVFIGDNAGRNNLGSGNVIIGFEAAKDQNLGNNFLWVKNSSSATPLIYGDFSNDKIGINCTNPQEAFSVVEDISATGTVLGSQMACSSDRRYKKDIHEMEQMLSAVLKLRPVRYRWKVKDFPDKHFPEKNQMGSIAQEVEMFYPELVLTNKEGYKSLDYARVTVILTKAIQEMHEMYTKEFQKLDKQNQNLIAKYEEMEQRIESLEAGTSKNKSITNTH